MANTLRKVNVPPEVVGSAKRVATPTVLQMQVTECGAASLGMILSAAGRWVSLEELRERCGASRDGTTGADLLRAARLYGMDGKGFYAARPLLAQIGFPLIVFWNRSHFLVLEGLDDRHAWLNDPASGPRRVTVEEFDRQYSKVCLALRPTDSFVKGGSPPSLNQSIMRRARPVLGEVAAVVALGLLGTLPGLAAAAISKLFVDDVLVRRNAGRAWPLVAALAIAAAVQVGLQLFQQRVLVRVGTRLTVAETGRFVHKSLRLPEHYFIARSVADLTQRTQQNGEVVGLLTGKLATVGVGLTVVVVYGVAMAFVDPILAAIAIALMVANLLAIRSGLRRQRDQSRLLTVEQSMLWQTTAYGAVTMETIKAGGLEGDYYARWEGAAVRVAGARQRMAVLSQVTSSVPGALRSLLTTLVLGVGAWRVLGGNLQIGSLVAFQALVGSFAAPFTEFAGFAALLQHVQNLVRRLDDVLDEPVDPMCDVPVTADANGARLEGGVELRRVTFGFKPNSPPLIDQFDLRLRPGDRIAVVGASGSGKSTLVRLVAGLHQAWSGEVLLDDLPRERIAREAMANSMAMVDQRIALFAGTVWDNLTLWDDTVPEADVVRAALDAQIHEVIVARVGGYAAQIDDGGINWSGGQRQRLEIARALVRNPSVLLLDEATSALDAETEAAVESALRRRGCTTLIVAHRLSTVRDADLILVMDKGVVVESGRHEDLLAKRGRYAELVNA